MDPEATLAALVDALTPKDGVWDEEERCTQAREAKEALEEWLIKGGFMPVVTRQQLLTILGTIDANYLE